ncbi:hypothetical protein C8Q74DRAFT_1217664 [Fomes fomentarius]|nr:hypothetical protein C8Q74DRAFT_1217664 [Fomes fomentarius]
MSALRGEAMHASASCSMDSEEWKTFDGPTTALPKRVSLHVEKLTRDHACAPAERENTPSSQVMSPPDQELVLARAYKFSMTTLPPEGRKATTHSVTDYTAITRPGLIYQKFAAKQSIKEAFRDDVKVLHVRLVPLSSLQYCADIIPPTADACRNDLAVQPKEAPKKMTPDGVPPMLWEKRPGSVMTKEPVGALSRISTEKQKIRAGGDS